jgi:predicted hotdog family 3-hydroxylacyl-ACP dehydratase
MCLLDRMVGWDAGRIECVAAGHRDPVPSAAQPSGLMAAAAIEYAAQAAALHGGLLARAAGAARRRATWRARARSGSAPGGSTTCPPRERRAEASSPSARPGDAGRLLYAFVVAHDGREIAAGRLAVVLDAVAG